LHGWGPAEDRSGEEEFVAPQTHEAEEGKRIRWPIPSFLRELRDLLFKLLNAIQF
jgi:hypothetical protein